MKKVTQLLIQFIFLVFDDWLSLYCLYFLTSSQYLEFVMQQRRIFIEKTKYFVRLYIFCLLTFLLCRSYLKASTIWKGNHRLACVWDYICQSVFVDGNWLLPELDKLFLDLLKVWTEPYDFLESSQAGDVKKVGFIVDKKVSKFVWLFL